MPFLFMQVVFLPECFDYVGENKEQTHNLAEPLNGPTISKLSKAAKDNKVWVSLGGFHEKVMIYRMG